MIKRNELEKCFTCKYYKVKCINKYSDHFCKHVNRNNACDYWIHWGDTDWRF